MSKQTSIVKPLNVLSKPVGEPIPMSNNEKISEIASHFQQILEILGLDTSNDSLKDTPKRVAKMYVEELFYGLNNKNKPAITLFDNDFGYGQMLIEKDIAVKSVCEHHFLPIVGFAHVAYISNGKIIGLSKLNRLVEFCAAKPQVQERLTIEIANELSSALTTQDVAVWVEAKHYCVSLRGVQHDESTTITFEFRGKFKEAEFKNQFLSIVKK